MGRKEPTTDNNTCIRTSSWAPREDQLGVSGHIHPPPYPNTNVALRYPFVAVDDTVEPVPFGGRYSIPRLPFSSPC